MSRWRILVVLTLVIVPFLVLALLGSLFLWEKGWGWLAWWPLAGCTTLGYLLGWYWQHKRQLLKPVVPDPPIHWTERDRQAWRLVEQRATAAASLDSDRLIQWECYTDTAREMALELAQFYHPGARDPIGSLTIPEILAVIELASHDLAETVDQYLPAGHLLTINNWRQARQATSWYQAANKAYWLISAAFAPVETAVRYGASRFGISTLYDLLQENVTLWFFTAYVQRLGSYLIDVNSGRLRVGARRYRELLQRASNQSEAGGQKTTGQAGQSETGETAHQQRPASSDHVTLTILGQVKAGKSSLINALLGEQKAFTDVLPATDEAQRYSLHTPLQKEGKESGAARLVLIDTVGYGREGPTADQLRATEEAAKGSDLLVIVLHAMNPARQPDLNMLSRLRDWFTSQPQLKVPPILGVMTHIDLLSPAMEWAPPYDWTQPRKPKERHIQEARNALREQLGDYLVGIVPLCTAEGKVYGLEEWFMPTLVELLDEARAVALLRCLRAEADAAKVKRVVQQVIRAGAEAAKALWRSAQK